MIFKKVVNYKKIYLLEISFVKMDAERPLHDIFAGNRYFQ